MARPVPSNCFYSDVDNIRRDRSADLCKDGLSHRESYVVSLAEASPVKDSVCTSYVHIYIYIYIYVCVCVCVCVRATIAACSTT